MDGFILINKDKGMTSHDIVNYVRKVYQTKKVGHLGTLDPLATGLLVLAINDATKLIPFIENEDKTYLAELTLGISSTTYDLEGEITERKDVPLLTEQQIDATLQSFLGKQMQMPPIYSAIKIKGKKLYQYAREKKEIEIPLREINIKSIERVGQIIFENNQVKFMFETTVSKGTYIRSLCVDIANRIGYPGVMSNLIRTKSGHFRLENALKIENLNKDTKKIPMLEALVNWHIITPTQTIYKKIIEGMKLNMNEVNGKEDVAFKWDNRLIGIYHLENNLYVAKRIWK